ncbi:sulfatase family protein [Flammeovirga kamogawensis]|uniref:Sulfatase n=1 Tax=Flammeovirga kamogawensis TaxID=373891 RepID=A0ABX8H1B9_9BACT|nr:sulfatase [Flammeovirga kamogawensis]MBB6462629.1 N-sulfoglucosamine sulfohydrolase [Flammeovirga kamogawensis]QWG09626.1 sulfatase [Flammeovirga kamogawensis]
MKSIYNSLLLFVFLTASINTFADKKPSEKLNILFITVDDMNWDSPGIYGNKIKSISPNIDGLAEGGIRFQHAYVQSPNCSPSRGVFQSGLYPHTSGMRGFYFVDLPHETLPQILLKEGYYTGVINKAIDSSFSPDFDDTWNYYDKIDGKEKRIPSTYYKHMNKFFSEAKKNKKPFYGVVNIADPHKLFYNDPGTQKEGYVNHPPSIIYKKNEVEIPEFLPNHPKIQQEITNYYNSVKRADDCLGAVLASLKNAGAEKNTIVIFVSDHGMALPFAKSSCYQNGVKTPWIIKWPGKIKQNTVEKEMMISAVDFMPTVLDILSINKPEHLQGISFLPTLEGKKQKQTELVFTEFNENAGGTPRPIRGIHSKKYNYVFNSWATGDLIFKSAAQSHASYKTMKQMAQTDIDVKRRFDYLNHRAVEELYDLEKDPNALNNLIDDPKYADIVRQMRGEMQNWMENTDDYLLTAFLAKEDKAKLAELMAKEEKEAYFRASSLKWKRHKNTSGKTKGHTKLYIVQ